jgi:hypothetical protein
MGAIASTTSPGKQNVPPFRGGTWELFYARRDWCQLPGGRPALFRETPVSLKKRIAMLR